VNNEPTASLSKLKHKKTKLKKLDHDDKLLLSMFKLKQKQNIKKVGPQQPTIAQFVQCRPNSLNAR
jgi:hypothetical protein